MGHRKINYIAEMNKWAEGAFGLLSVVIIVICERGKE